MPQSLYVSPAGSVGASALQRCPPDTRTFAMTKRPVILNAKRERIRNTFKRERIAARLAAFTITKRPVILNAKRERIRNTLKRERIATHLAAVSPAGSVGASASQRCPPDTCTAMTKQLVILSAKRERIRSFLNIFKYNTVVITRK